VEKEENEKTEKKKKTDEKVTNTLAVC